MRTLLTFILCLLSVTSYGQYRPNTYTTNRQAAADAYIMSIVSGPTNGITATVATNIAAYQAQLATNGPSVALLNRSPQTFTGATNSFTGDLGVNGIVSAGTLYVDGNLTSGGASINGVLFAELVDGDGSGLTNLNASSLASGTVAMARLPASIQDAITNNYANTLVLKGTSNQIDGVLNVAGLARANSMRADTMIATEGLLGGTTTADENPFHFVEIQTTNSYAANRYSLRSDFTVTQTNTESTYGYAALLGKMIFSNTNRYLTGYGSYGLGYAQQGASLQSLYGGRFVSENVGIGTLTNAYGVSGQIELTSSGGAEIAAAVRAATPLITGSGTITGTNVGVLVEDQAFGTGQQYSVLTLGSAPAKFGGKINAPSGFAGLIASGDVTNAAGSRVAYLSDIVAGGNTNSPFLYTDTVDGFPFVSGSPNTWENVGRFTSTNMLIVDVGGGLIFGDIDASRQAGSYITPSQIIYTGDGFGLGHTDFTTNNYVLSIWGQGSGTVTINPNYQLIAAGGTLSGAVYSTASTATNGAANNELVTAQFVRGLFDGFGVSYYNTTNTSVSFTNNDIVTANTTIYTYSPDVGDYGRRTYTTPTNNEYLGQTVTTNKFLQLNAGVTVNAYLEATDGSGTGGPTIKPEIYVSYDGTNWLGDWDAAAQFVPEGATNLYTWVVSNPTYISTNATGFYVQRRFKMVAQTTPAASTIHLHVGTGKTSHIVLSAASSSSGNVYAAANNTFTAQNNFPNLNMPTNTPTDAYVLTATGTSGSTAWKAAASSPGGGSGISNTIPVTLLYEADKTNFFFNASSATVATIILTNNSILNITNATTPGFAHGEIRRVFFARDGVSTWQVYTTNSTMIGFGQDITGITIGPTANSSAWASWAWNSLSNRWDTVGNVSGF